MHLNCSPCTLLSSLAASKGGNTQHNGFCYFTLLYHNATASLSIPHFNASPSLHFPQDAECSVGFMVPVKLGLDDCRLLPPALVWIIIIMIIQKYKKTQSILHVEVCVVTDNQSPWEIFKKEKKRELITTLKSKVTYFWPMVMCTYVSTH